MNLKKLVNYNDPNSFASRLRRKRAQRLAEVVAAITRARGSCRILDVGGTHAYWNIFADSWFAEFNVSITLLNLEAVPVPENARDRFSSVAGDACRLAGYGNGEFDLVHSNSVIEHVGSWERMCSMAGEARRVGRNVYLQTPYFWFPIEPHFLTPFVHWLPMSARTWLAGKTAMGNWPRAANLDEAIRAQQSAVLLDKRMMNALFPDARVHFERFAGLPKSLIAIRTAD